MRKLSGKFLRFCTRKRSETYITIEVFANNNIDNVDVYVNFVFQFGKDYQLYTRHINFYRPQTKFGPRQYFCTCLSFCSQGGGGVPGQVPPRQVYPPGQVHPVGRYTPSAGTPPLARYTPSNACWDTVNKRAIHILLECILV